LQEKREEIQDLIFWMSFFSFWMEFTA